MKHVEMTVRRALALIDVFQRWEERFNKSGYQGVQDWRDIDPSEYRKVMGDDHYGIQPQMEIEELWRRYKSGQLHEEVLALADNLVMDDLEDPGRKEIRDGTRRIRKEFDR